MTAHKITRQMHARADLIFSLLYVSARAHVGGFAFLDPSEKLHRQHFAHMRAQSARALANPTTAMPGMIVSTN